jgi:putative ABC transport system permease protein
VAGGAAGVLLAWLVSFPGDSVARSLVNESSDLHLTGRLFVFPAWLVLGLPLFAAVVTTLAAVYPARRAARVNPIAALRHE